jgi:hypothetical protein
MKGFPKVKKFSYTYILFLKAIFKIWGSTRRFANISEII